MKMNEVATAALGMALDMLRKTKPRNLAETMKFIDTSIEAPNEAVFASLISHLRTCGTNDGVLHSFTLAVQGWDHEESPAWGKSTTAHSADRRDLVIELLGFSSNQGQVINGRIHRLSGASVPIVIAEAHAAWYSARKPKINDFYWSHYIGQLSDPRSGWDSPGIARLDASTDDVVSRLSDPTREELYPVKGLVMGYVQSGKTSHFSGLIAKAGDAGYRLIIVLAGTLDILRRQTQRRIDKEIVGSELLDPEEYKNDSEWAKFVSHGGRPSGLGTFDWERITTLLDDYTSLKKHLSVLEFKPAEPDQPFNHPDNLRTASAKLGVIKKVPARIDKLCDDLRRLKKLRSALEHVPTLIIDDESDQASVNTIDQRKPGNEGKKTSTNKSISNLLQLLPRAQYVGYTATPFANVFIDPDDAENLFPKDFIVSLPRPDGYMGVSDFYDFDADYPPGDFRGNKNAFVRPVEGDNSAPDNLPRAIDSFVIAGAVKLYRQKVDPKRYRYKHHTMLIHYSATQVVHDAQKAEVESLFGTGARYQTSEGIKRLRHIFEQDFVPVSAAKGEGAPIPQTFDELRPFVSECLSRICLEHPVRVVNGDEKHKDETPDFDQSPVWAILIGGAKLSRGYTVEGLTVSYYRRPTGAGDTLMQMGRWFGFRHGYRDLVRLFIGSKERKGKVLVDLYEAFGAVCRDEEALRGELLKYKADGLTPKQVPPLVRQHLPQLPPTSKNKMFNAQIGSRDFSGDWTEKATTPHRGAEAKSNLDLAEGLVASSTITSKIELAFTDVARESFHAYVGVAEAASVLRFLDKFLWGDSKRLMSLELEYIKREVAKGSLTNWLVLLPQLQSGETIPLSGVKNRLFSTIRRARISETRFGVFSDPKHRKVAAYFAGVGELSQPNSGLTDLVAAYGRVPVLVLYFVRERGVEKSELSVGFGLQYPGKKQDAGIIWVVKDRAHADAVVVPA